MYPTLLDLPLELRHQIFEIVFFGAELSTLCKCHRPNPFQRANYGILAANKQLHHEASTVLFRGAVLRLDIIKMRDRAAYDRDPHLATKTVIPVWSWYVRDRYRDSGTDLEFLRRWQGLKKMRHVEVRYVEMSRYLVNDNPWLVLFPSFERVDRCQDGCEMAVEFLNGLPGLESLAPLAVYPDRDSGVSSMEMWKGALCALTTAGLVELARDDCCGPTSRVPFVAAPE